MLETEPNPDLVALLAWYKAMGVDAAVADDAVDWLAHGEHAAGRSPGVGIVTTEDGATASNASPADSAHAWAPSFRRRHSSTAVAPGPVARTAEPRQVPVRHPTKP